MNKNTRYLIFSISILIAFCFTFVRLIQTTLFPDNRLQKFITEPTTRGNIYDRKGRLIAGVSSANSLYARPKFLSRELQEYIKQYMDSTGFFSYEELKKFNESDKHFIYIKRNMPPSVFEPIQAILNDLKKSHYIKNDTLGITTEESRFYSYLCLSPIIGLVGQDTQGLEGIEYTLNDHLESGHHITLTLDAELCKTAYEELLKTVTESQAYGGSIGIIDIKSREILALAQISENPKEPLVCSHIYEPGSVMKLFTAAFALEQGLASIDKPLFDDETPYRVGKYAFYKPRYGHIPLSTMLTKSANISFARLSSEFSSEDYHLWLTELGFGKKPNLPLTHLEKGILHPPKKWSGLSKPMIAIGQEIGITTLQLLIAASVIGGKGTFIEPSLVLSVENNKGITLKKDAPQQSQQLFHPEKSKELLLALENVVSPQGTGRRAALDNIRIAGKTGTGMIADASGYSTGKNNTVFLGILPVETPTLAIIVTVHHPKGLYRSGGGISAPLFADIIRRILLSFHYHKS